MRSRQLDPHEANRRPRLSSTAFPIRWCCFLGDPAWHAARHPLGVVAALHRGSFLDRAAGTSRCWHRHAELLARHPVDLRLQRRAGLAAVGRMGGPAHYVLPVITLGAFLVAGFMRITRSAMLEVMEASS